MRVYHESIALIVLKASKIWNRNVQKIFLVRGILIAVFQSISSWNFQRSKSLLSDKFSPIVFDAPDRVEAEAFVSANVKRRDNVIDNVHYTLSNEILLNNNFQQILAFSGC